MKRKYCLAITDNHKNLEVTATLFRTCNICLAMRINAKELVHCSAILLVWATGADWSTYGEICDNESGILEKQTKANITVTVCSNNR